MYNAVTKRHNSIAPDFELSVSHTMRLGAISVAVLLFVASHADAGRVLGLFPHTGRSHQMVFEPLLQTLAERGHQVTVVSFFPQKNPPKNYTDVSMAGLAEIGMESIDLQIFEIAKSTLPGVPTIQRLLKQIMEFNMLADIGLEVCNKLVDFQPLSDTLKKEYDVVLVENFQSDCMLGLAHVHGVQAPVIAVLSSSFMPWSMDRIGGIDNPSYVPVVSNAFSSDMNFLERLENTFLCIYYKIWYRYAIQVKEQAMIERRFGKFTDLRDISKNMTLMMANTFHSLNGVRPTLPGIIEVGGMHLNQPSKTIPKYVERFINESEHGAIIFSFGSLIKSSTMPKHKQEIFINVLSKLKQRVIWKYEDSGEEGTFVADNIMRVKWLPQYDLLQHEKVIAFIAHGGLLGMTEAIAAGKPMLVMPFFGDQPFNAAAAQKAGIAVVTSYPDLKEESLSEALRMVLSAEMRVSARRASAIWHDRPSAPLQSAVYWVERVLRWRHEAPLHSSSRHMSFLQYTLLDVTAAAAATLVLALLLLKKLCSLAFRLLFSKPPAKDKPKKH